MSTVFELNDPSKMISPALIYYKDTIIQNTRLAIEMAGGAQRLWPHVKSHKMKKMVKLQLEMGIRRFKCATIAEAEMTAAAGADHVLLAYPLIGPNLKRFLELIKAFPNTRFWAIGDDFEQLSVLSEHAVQRHMKIDTLLDVNMGMNRTGVPLQQAEQLYEKATQLPGLSLKGMHCYDGNHNDSDLQVRLGQVREADLQVKEIQVELMKKKIECSTMIMGGTPSFPCHALVTEWFLSPGTAFIDDAGYQKNLPDLSFEPAAAILTRVISHPAPGLFTLDLGYKGIAADPAGVRGIIAGFDRAHVLFQSEEHWVFKMNPEHENEVPAIGTVFYVIPTHICPTSALYPAVLVAQNGNIIEEWEVTARNRKLTF